MSRYGTVRVACSNRWAFIERERRQARWRLVRYLALGAGILILWGLAGYLDLLT